LAFGLSSVLRTSSNFSLLRALAHTPQAEK
jgi:hypothetical protein